MGASDSVDGWDMAGPAASISSSTKCTNSLRDGQTFEPDSICRRQRESRVSTCSRHLSTSHTSIKPLYVRVIGWERARAGWRRWRRSGTGS